MHGVHVVTRVALGIVFVVAGAGKVAAGRTWPTQAAALGVVRGVALVVPWTELAVGALVMVGLGEPWPSAVALAMLLLFTVVLVRVLRQGRRPPCACFGTWSAKPLGWPNVYRNAFLTALAVLAILTS